MGTTRNWLLIAGISLPVVLLGVFFLISVVAQQVVEPPSFDLYYNKYEYTATELVPVQLTYSVVLDRLQVNGVANRTAYRNRLYRFDVRNQKSTEVTIEIPKTLTDGNAVIEVIALASARVSPEREAPDGFVFRNGRDRGPGLIGELFSSRNHQGFTLESSGATFHYETIGTSASSEIQFVGWVIGDE
jgi:hypothetical protein